MNEISPDQLLSQIRTMGRSLQAPQLPTEPQATGFGEMLKNTLDTVNEAQQTATEMKVGFVNETGDASLAEVMIAAQKASLQFRAVTEVRNKLVQAYQDIMNMPV
ncbi:MAG: flagellar hook-basal body complex protein FliE [Woeseiaceae bacterium]|nr:flagellar hook-basal body complex protein FliE [Woeseiaceae bacterium]